MSENVTHPQDEFHPFYSDQVCPYCRHKAGVPCDDRGRNVDLAENQVMFCANCCEAMEINRERQIRRCPPRKLMQLVLLRPNEMLRLFMALQEMKPHQEHPR